MNREWDILATRTKKTYSKEEIVSILLKNRGIESVAAENDFFSPPNPLTIPLATVGIDAVEIKKAIKRVKQAIKNKEKVVIFGDYDADGVTGTAILWEYLHALGLDVWPHLPERFSEGYGLQPGSITLLKEKYQDVSLIITVDNGIVAHEACKAAKKEGIDIIITDHHEALADMPPVYALIHTTKTSGSATAWFFVRELAQAFKGELKTVENFLELAAIGTIADQLPLLEVNRSIVKFGLEALNKTSRVGLTELINLCGISRGSIGSYEVGFVLAPRINAMGRMKHAIDSLRLLCTRDKNKAQELALSLNSTNLERQKTVEEVVIHARERAHDGSTDGILILSSSTYHEGVIGLAAAKLVEEFYRPAIVFSQGEETSKASARSIVGFSIIEAIRAVGDILVAGGGHTMAAGFTIKTSDLAIFQERIQAYARTLLTDELKLRRMRIDMPLLFSEIDWQLADKLMEFAPFGTGNASPVFLSNAIKVKKVKAIGREANHLKLILNSEGRDFDGIGFNMATNFPDLSEGALVDIVYHLEKNLWNGHESLQLRVKDMKIYSNGQ